MKFKCIKEIKDDVFGEKVFFKKDAIYENVQLKRREKKKELVLISEFDSHFMVAKHWLHYKFDSFFREHFIQVK